MAGSNGPQDRRGHSPRPGEHAVLTHDRRNSRQKESQERKGASAGHTATSSTVPSGSQRGKMEKEEVIQKHDTIDDWSEEALLRVDLDKELEPSTTEKPQFKLSILKGRNYDIWASEFRRCLESRGILCIVTGDLPIPRDRRNKARRWIILDQWIAGLIYCNVGETLKRHIDNVDLKNSKAMWDELKRIDGGRE